MELKVCRSMLSDNVWNGKTRALEKNILCIAVLYLYLGKLLFSVIIKELFRRIEEKTSQAFL